MAAKDKESQFFSIIFLFFNVNKQRTWRKPAYNYVPKHLLALPGHEECGEDASLSCLLLFASMHASTQVSEPPCTQQLHLDSLAY